MNFCSKFFILKIPALFFVRKIINKNQVEIPLVVQFFNQATTNEARSTSNNNHIGEDNSFTGLRKIAEGMELIIPACMAFSKNISIALRPSRPKSTENLLTYKSMCFFLTSSSISWAYFFT